MKRFALTLALLLGGFFCLQTQAQAAHVQLGIGLGVGTGGIHLNVGTQAFNQRYVPVGQAWVNEPYVYWQNVPDPVTGRIYRVQRIAYTRRLVVLYYDNWQGGYGYFDRWGNPIPWNNRFPW